MRYLNGINVEAKDVGATQEVIIRIGDTEVIRFRPGTKHADRAMEIGLDVVTDSLRELFAKTIKYDPYNTIV